MRSPLSPMSTHLLCQELAPTDCLWQATCVTLGIVLNFDAAHKTQNTASSPQLCLKSALLGGPHFSEAVLGNVLYSRNPGQDPFSLGEACVCVIWVEQAWVTAAGFQLPAGL